MKEIKLPDSEIKVMDFLWEQGETTARETASYMEKEYLWKKNTTYTVLKNLRQKGAISRNDPGFRVKALIERQQVGQEEAKSLLRRFYKGSVAALFSSFLEQKVISQEELDEIRTMIESSHL